MVSYFLMNTFDLCNLFLCKEYDKDSFFLSWGNLTLNLFSFA